MAIMILHSTSRTPLVTRLAMVSVKVLLLMLMCYGYTLHKPARMLQYCCQVTSSRQSGHAKSSSLLTWWPVHRLNSSYSVPSNQRGSCNTKALTRRSASRVSNSSRRRCAKRSSWSSSDPDAECAAKFFSIAVLVNDETTSGSVMRGAAGSSK